MHSQAPAAQSVPGLSSGSQQADVGLRGAIPLSMNAQGRGAGIAHAGIPDGTVQPVSSRAMQQGRAQQCRAQAHPGGRSSRGHKRGCDKGPKAAPQARSRRATRPR
jgi:hypothetical protein